MTGWRQQNNENMSGTSDSREVTIQNLSVNLTEDLSYLWPNYIYLKAQARQHTARYRLLQQQQMSVCLQVERMQPKTHPVSYFIAIFTPYNLTLDTDEALTLFSDANVASSDVSDPARIWDGRVNGAEVW